MSFCYDLSEVKPYKVIKTLPPKARTKAEKILIKVDGHEVEAFRKSTEDEEVARLIQHQAESIELVNAIGAKSNPSFRAPKTYDFGPGFIITEWIDGEPLSKSLGGEPEKSAAILAPMLYAFDKFGVKPQIAPSYSFFKPFAESMAVWREDIQARIEAALMDQDLFDRTVRLLDQLYPKLTSCLQDADIKPDHLYPDPAGQADFVLIDSEHIRDNWPRYYDLGNLIAKYAVSKPLPAFRKKLLEDFLELCQTPPTEIFDPLRATLLVRGLGFTKEFELPPTTDPEPKKKLITELLEKTLSAKTLQDLI